MGVNSIATNLVIITLVLFVSAAPTTSLDFYYDDYWELYYTEHEGHIFYEDDDWSLTEYDENHEATSSLLPLDVDYWYAYYNCDDVSQAQIIYDDESWNLLQDRYNELDGQKPLKLSLNGERMTGFEVPIEVQFVEGKGRGIIATSHIRKGELIYSGQFNLALFRSLESLYNFLSSVPQEMVCDILAWAYNFDFGDFDGSSKCSPFVAIDIGEGALFNDIDKESDENVGCHPMFDDIFPELCKTNYFALDNIYPGEELILNYDEFTTSYEEGWRYFNPIIIPLNYNSTSTTHMS